MITTISIIVLLLEFTFALKPLNEHFETQQSKFNSVNVKSSEDDEHNGTERKFNGNIGQAGFLESKFKQFARRYKRQLHVNSRCTRDFFDRHLRQGRCLGVGQRNFRQELNETAYRFGSRFTLTANGRRSRNTFIVHPRKDPEKICQMLLRAVSRKIRSRRRKGYDWYEVTINFNEDVFGGYKLRLVDLQDIIWKDLGEDLWDLRFVGRCTCGKGTIKLRFFYERRHQKHMITINHFHEITNIKDHENCAL
ncbi:unnamed protein product [Mytilus coruscus]|uniref:Uncharacterized protein n=1 Tax=Mytilus coruscus TaxID=42192 RepID=A0A6J8C1T7_MYTCO|nr:unnamed protein product [Mytilus coruscus]